MWPLNRTFITQGLRMLGKKGYKKFYNVYILEK